MAEVAEEEEEVQRPEVEQEQVRQRLRFLRLLPEVPPRRPLASKPAVAKSSTTTSGRGNSA